MSEAERSNSGLTIFKHSVLLCHVPIRLKKTLNDILSERYAFFDGFRQTFAARFRQFEGRDTGEDSETAEHDLRTGFPEAPANQPVLKHLINL